MGRQHLDQSSLAKRLGKAQPWVSRRVGKNADIALNLDDLEAFAAALNVPATRLLRWDEVRGQSTWNVSPERLSASRQPVAA
jgi:transcriptional regulator with XRE-family HTH domain